MVGAKCRATTNSCLLDTIRCLYLRVAALARLLSRNLFVYSDPGHSGTIKDIKATEMSKLPTTVRINHSMWRLEDMLHVSFTVFRAGKTINEYLNVN